MFTGGVVGSVAACFPISLHFLHSRFFRRVHELMKGGCYFDNFIGHCRILWSQLRNLVCDSPKRNAKIVWTSECERALMIMITKAKRTDAALPAHHKHHSSTSMTNTNAFQDRGLNAVFKLGRNVSTHPN